jgi:hypothetical protein
MVLALVGEVFERTVHEAHLLSSQVSRGGIWYEGERFGSAVTAETYIQHPFRVVWECDNIDDVHPELASALSTGNYKGLRGLSLPWHFLED